MKTPFFVGFSRRQSNTLKKKKRHPKVTLFQ